MVVDPHFWKNKKVFITGHTGFKGSWLSLVLRHFQAKVRGYSLVPPTSPNLFELVQLDQKIDSQIGDIRNINEFRKSIESFQPEIVIHMAAQPLVRESYSQPVETFQTNVMGTIHLLEILRNVQSVRSTVIVTTDKCYENKEWLWPYRENEPMGGKDPYSASKACAELVTSSYRSSFFQQDENRNWIASARAGNVVGGGDWAKDRLVPDLMVAFSKGEKPPIRYPEAIRPWQHVLEPVGGYLLLAQNLYESGSQFAEAWNFGPEDTSAVTVRQIVKSLVDHWGPGAGFVEAPGPDLHEASLLKLDISKAKHHLQWSPRWGLDETLRLTCEWYKTYYLDSKQNAAMLCDQQIEMYFNLV